MEWNEKINKTTDVTEKSSKRILRTILNTLKLWYNGWLPRKIQGETQSQNNPVPVKEMLSIGNNFTTEKTPHSDGLIWLLPNIQETDHSIPTQNRKENSSF